MPISTLRQTPEVSRTSVPQRSHAAIHRGNPLIASLQIELASIPESLSSDSSLYDLIDSRSIYATTISTSTSTSTSSRTSANTSTISISPSTRLPCTFHHLPLVITGCVNAGMSVCEIGQYLHRVICTNTNVTDSSILVSSTATGHGIGLVNRMLAANKPYYTIATRVMRILDLRNSDGCPLYAYVDPGDLDLVPRRGEETARTDSGGNRNGKGNGGIRHVQATTQPKRERHWAPGQGLLRCWLGDMSDEEVEGLVEVRDEDDCDDTGVRGDGQRVGLPRLANVSQHTVTIVHPSSPPRSVRVEFRRVGSDSMWI
ncbi:hypothetical protein BJX63DRAFT_435972 [Aspergillus granulosus]|uniref:Uncharacterized protein n=1 Tax=Aspergillus granulosus TaxID=176169 RepID=A0ABR4GZI6_9EURO